MAEITPKGPDYTQVSNERIPPWRDVRLIGVFVQIGFLIIVAVITIILVNNVRNGLWRLGNAQFLCADQTTSERCFFDFLQLDAQFDIAEKPIDYTPADSYARAIYVGFLNTLKVSVVGVILTTILGTFVGVLRLSPNWLVSNVAKWYVDIMRNTPLLLILLLLYLVVLLGSLPSNREALQPLGLPIFLSQRGINYPSIETMPSFPTWLAFIVLAIIQAQVLWVALGRREELTGKDSNRLNWVVFTSLVVIGIGWFVAGSNASNHSFMVPNNLRIREFGDFETLMTSRFGLNDIGDLEKGIASGAISAEALSENALKVCALDETASQVNLLAQLRSAGIPYETRLVDRPGQATSAYADGSCEVFVADTGVLAAERNILDDANAQTIIPLAETPVRLSIPALEGLNFVGGSKITPEYAAVLFGLVIYTGAFVAEIVRAGIQAIPKGQTEAARALGLSEGKLLSLIILPQALRIIIPPTTSQYLNLVKNSSLAQFVAYPEIWTVAFTTTNQSGRAVQVVIIVMVTYLTISLTISGFLNWYNGRISLSER
jgi:general L-amino acid transport system permease protein